MRLLNLLSTLLLECHVSLDKLCDMIALLQDPLLPTYVKNIYRTLNSSTFDEYRYFLNSLQSVKEECDLCPKPGESGTVIETMDACFGFTRKKSAGKSINPPIYEMKMFADQADVDNFVSKHSKDTRKAENPCNQYKAGEVEESINSKGRNKKYDEKAVFGRICRHGFPKGFISLKHGERIAYAVYELKRMIEPYRTSDDIEVKCMYDIACILESHLQINRNYDLEDLVEKIQFGIPIFHSYVHIAKCQVSYSPRRVAGFALTDGEGIERLWSYLRRFSSMTKEMRPSRRTDILTEALIHYDRRVARNHGNYMIKSLKRSSELHEKATKELDEILSNLPAAHRDPPHHVIKSWREEEWALVSRKKASSQSSSWEESYVKLLWDYFQSRSSIASIDVDNQNSNQSDLIAKCKSIDEKLKIIEKKNGLRSRWKIGQKEFTKTMLLLEQQRRESTLQHLYCISIERHLQLILKARYSQRRYHTKKYLKLFFRFELFEQRSKHVLPGEMNVWEDVSQELMSYEEDLGSSLKVKSPHWRCWELTDLLVVLDEQIKQKNAEEMRQPLRKQRLIAELPMKRQPSKKLKET
eukprot:Seg801.5 transcript_id=Seg801.5/GoldUCD/mRNA.D3Y31 product="hypothetical protein" protein_id=Seg801.5/GoldUCD/D3Y31